MLLARVVGDVVATHRHQNLGGRKLLLVRRRREGARRAGGERRARALPRHEDSRPGGRRRRRRPGRPVWVARYAQRLKGSEVQVATVIGFPLGTSRSDVKAFEGQRAVDDGAEELDMVAAIGHIKGGDWHYVACSVQAPSASSSGQVY